MMDNATNNDTMMQSLERKHRAANIKFDGQKARVRCMPHTIHLAAEKVCIYSSDMLPILTAL